MDIRLVLLLCFLVASGCSGQVTDIGGPANQAVLVSTPSVTFTCTVTQNPALTTYVGWDECITRGGGDCLRIFNDLTNVYVDLGGDPERATRYGISNPSTMTYDLSISPLTLNEDSGKYRCISLNNPDFYQTAQLILLDGNPVCTNNATNNQAVEGDYIRYSCEVPYRGRWAPVMEWDNKGVPVNGVVDESTSNIARFSFTIQVTPDDNGNTYRCRTFFEDPTGLGENEATNTPSYNYPFTFEPLTVFYPPDEITISWGVGCLTPGDKMTCNAIGNPPPSYQWIDVNTTQVIGDQAELFITEEMLGYQWYMCEASNNYGTISDQATLQVCPEY